MYIILQFQLSLHKLIALYISAADSTMFNMKNTPPNHGGNNKDIKEIATNGDSNIIKYFCLSIAIPDPSIAQSIKPLNLNVILPPYKLNKKACINSCRKHTGIINKIL